MTLQKINKITALFFIVLLVGTLTASFAKAVPLELFWIVVVLAAVYAYIVMPKLRKIDK